MNYDQAVELVKEYGKNLNANDPRFKRHVSIVFYDDSTLELNNSFLMDLGGHDMEYIAVFSVNHEDKVYPMSRLIKFEQYEVVSKLEELKAKSTEVESPVCNTCDDTHMMTIYGRGDVMCTHCPVPCAKCNNGPYCKKTPCDCSCHNRA